MLDFKIQTILDREKKITWIKLDWKVPIAKALWAISNGVLIKYGTSVVTFNNWNHHICKIVQVFLFYEHRYTERFYWKAKIRRMESRRKNQTMFSLNNVFILIKIHDAQSLKTHTCTIPFAKESVFIHIYFFMEKDRSEMDFEQEIYAIEIVFDTCGWNPLLAPLSLLCRHFWRFASSISVSNRLKL